MIGNQATLTWVPRNEDSSNFAPTHPSSYDVESVTPLFTYKKSVPGGPALSYSHAVYGLPVGEFDFKVTARLAPDARALPASVTRVKINP